MRGGRQVERERRSGVSLLSVQQTKTSENHNEYWFCPSELELTGGQREKLIG